jgi:hypothetical protein
MHASCSYAPTSPTFGLSTELISAVNPLDGLPVGAGPAQVIPSTATSQVAIRVPVAVVGRSHMVALKEAQDIRDGAGRISCSFTNTSNYEPLSQDGSITPLPPDFVSLLNPVMTHSQLVALMTNGNEHNFIALLRHDPPLDVVTSYEPNLPIVPGAQLISERAILWNFDRSMGDLRSILAYIRGTTPNARTVVMGPPPPIFDNGFIASNLGVVFSERIKNKGKEPSPEMMTEPLVRWKLWRILQGCYQRVANDFDIPFMEVPAAGFDSSGRFLAPVANGGGGTHANASFGELRLQQIEALL